MMDSCGTPKGTERPTADQQDQATFIAELFPSFSLFSWPSFVCLTQDAHSMPFVSRVFGGPKSWASLLIGFVPSSWPMQAAPCTEKGVNDCNKMQQERVLGLSRP